MQRKICQSCKGNGYLKVIEARDHSNSSEQLIKQCDTCNSEGEIIIKEENDRPN